MTQLTIILLTAQLIVLQNLNVTINFFESLMIQEIRSLLQYLDLQETAFK